MNHTVNSNIPQLKIFNIKPVFKIYFKFKLDLKMEKPYYEEHYEKLESVLNKALEGLEIHKNESISNEVNAVCKDLNEKYLFELKSMICLMFHEIKKISNHFVQTINWFNQQKGEILVEDSSEVQNEDVKKLNKYLSKTIELIEKSSLIAEMNEIQESNSELIETINDFLTVTKEKHVSEVNDLTIFIGDSAIN
jgi:hypothetical protein